MIGYAQAARSGEASPAGTAELGFGLGPRALLIGAVLIAAFAAFIRPVTDGDFWWHVRTGRWIVEHRGLPGHDLFTYTVSSHRWIDHEYLTEVLTWLVNARLGMAGVSIAFGLLTWLGFFLIAAAARPRRHPYVIVGLVLALAAVAGYPVWGPRPQIVTFVLACLELLWLRRFLEGSSRAILWLPVLTALWGNLHGGWPVAFLFLGIAAVSCLAGWLGDRTQVEQLGRARLLALIGLLSAGTLLVNPNGLAVYAYPFQTLTSAAQQGLIAEWQSPDFHAASLRAFEAMLLLSFAALALGRPTLFDVLVVIAGTALALEAVRHISLFVAAATPVLIMCLSDAWRRRTVRMIRLLPAAPPRRSLAVVTLVSLAVVAAGVGGRVADDLGQQPAMTSRTVPVGAAGWLAAHPATGTKMFNQYVWGGYLADRFYPDPHRKLFVFSEGVLMGDELLLRYNQVAGAGAGWQSVLDGAGVDYVVFDSGSALDAALSVQPGWRLAYRDTTAVVYLRSP